MPTVVTPNTRREPYVRPTHVSAGSNDATAPQRQSTSTPAPRDHRVPDSYAGSASSGRITNPCDRRLPPERGPEPNEPRPGTAVSVPGRAPGQMPVWVRQPRRPVSDPAAPVVTDAWTVQPRQRRLPQRAAEIPLIEGANVRVVPDRPAARGLRRLAPSVSAFFRRCTACLFKAL